MTGKPISQAEISVDKALLRLGDLCQKFLVAATGEIQREMSSRIPVDTGMARAHIRSETLDKGARVGILYPFSRDGNVATYPAMMEMGIRRHYVSLYNSDGSLRHSLAAWVVRHGLGYWRTSRWGKKYVVNNSGRKIRGLKVWGYRVAWLSSAIDNAVPRIQAYLNSLEGKL